MGGRRLLFVLFGALVGEGEARGAHPHVYVLVLAVLLFPYHAHRLQHVRDVVEAPALEG